MSNDKLKVDDIIPMKCNCDICGKETKLVHKNKPSRTVLQCTFCMAEAHVEEIEGEQLIIKSSFANKETRQKRYDCHRLMDLLTHNGIYTKSALYNAIRDNAFSSEILISESHIGNMSSEDCDKIGLFLAIEIGKHFKLIPVNQINALSGRCKDWINTLLKSNKHNELPTNREQAREFVKNINKKVKKVPKTKDELLREMKEKKIKESAGTNEEIAETLEKESKEVEEIQETVAEVGEVKEEIKETVAEIKDTKVEEKKKRRKSSLDMDLNAYVKGFVRQAVREEIDDLIDKIDDMSAKVDKIEKELNTISDELSGKIKATTFNYEELKKTKKSVEELKKSRKEMAKRLYDAEVSIKDIKSNPSIAKDIIKNSLK